MQQGIIRTAESLSNNATNEMKESYKQNMETSAIASAQKFLRASLLSGHDHIIVTSHARTIHDCLALKLLQDSTSS